MRLAKATLFEMDDDGQNLEDGATFGDVFSTKKEYFLHATPGDEHNRCKVVSAHQKA